MGIKDWFGGDKKKAEFREKVKEAVSDGKLSSRDLAELEKAKKELDVEDLSDDKTKVRREIYNEAVAAVKDKGQLSSTDAHELAKIQKFLSLRDDQVAKTRWDLARFKTLTEVQQGKFPTVAPNHAVLSGVQLEPGEIPHYTLAAEMLDQGVTRGAEGVRIEWGVRYAAGAAQEEQLPLEGAKPLGEGHLLITNRRLIFKGSKTSAVKFAKEALISVYADGIRLERTIGNAIIKYKTPSPEGAEIVAEIVSKYMGR